MSDVIPLKYVAFLSYSHNDSEIGEALHRELENYRIPLELIGQAGTHGAVPSKLRPIFRDRFDLEAGPSLRDQVTDALANSQAMVVICSRASAKSTYVNEEIRQFKALGRAHRIYPIIVDGEPGDPDRECFPPALRHVVDAEGNITRFLEEPIAADARDHADGEELARLKIISGLLGVDLDRLRRREAEEQKRQKRFWIGISTFMAMLAVFALVASGLAWFQREQKREALTKNENLLDKTLERTSKLVSNGVRSVDRHGLPSKFGLSLLQEAQGYFDDMDAIKVTSKQMQLRRAEMLIGLSASYKLLGRGEDALSNSRRARDILNAEVERLQAEGSPVPNEVYYQLARSHIYLARGQADRGWVDFALASSRTGIKILDEHLGGIDSRNPEWLQLRGDLLLELAHQHGRRREWDQAFEYIGECRELGKRLGEYGLTGPAIRARALALSKLADFNRRRGNVERAMEATLIGEPMIQMAVSLNPEDLLWKGRLHELLIIRGDIHYKARRFDEALQVYQQANEVVAENHKQDPQNARIASMYALSNYKIAEVAPRLGKLDLADQAGTEAVEVYERLIKIDPKSQTYNSNIMHALEALGDVQRRLNKKEEMARSHERRLKLAEQLLDRQPSNRSWLRHAATSSFMAGEAYKSMGQPKRGREKFEVALRYRLKQIESGNASARVKFNRAWTILSIGFTYADQKNFERALPLYRQAVELMEPLMTSFAPGTYYQRRYVDAVESVAEALSKTGSPRQGLEWFDKVIDLRRSVAQANQAYEFRRALAHTQEMTGSAWLKLGDTDKALALFEENLASRVAFHEEEPEDPQRRRNMANAQKLAATVRLQRRDCNKAHEQLALAHENLSRAMADQEEQTGIPKSEWNEQLKEIEVLQAKASSDCPRTSDAGGATGRALTPSRAARAATRGR